MSKDKIQDEKRDSKKWICAQVYVQRDQWQKIKAKVSLKGISLADWFREKINEEIKNI